MNAYKTPTVCQGTRIYETSVGHDRDGTREGVFWGGEQEISGTVCMHTGSSSVKMLALAMGNCEIPSGGKQWSPVGSSMAAAPWVRDGRHGWWTSV